MSKRTANILRRLKIMELSGVDAGASPDARVVLVKRADIAPLVALCKMYGSTLDDEAKATSFREALANNLRREMEWKVDERMYPLFDALRETVMSAAKTLEGEALEEQLTENVMEFLRSARTAMQGDEEEVEMAEHSKMTEEMKSRYEELKASGMDDKEAQAQAMRELTKQEGHMDLNELKDSLASMEAQVDALNKRNEVLAKALDAAGYDVGEDGAVEKRAAPEMVEVDGEMVEKRLVPEPVLRKLAKVDDLEKRDHERTLEKRGAAELPDLAGSDIAKGRLLEAVGKLPEAEATEMLETLKAANGFAKAHFQAIGKNSALDPEHPNAKIEALAKARFDAGEFDTIEMAKAAVLKSREGRELRKQAATMSQAH